IGLPLPRAALEICRQRLTRAHFDRATILAEVFDPESAVTAGFFDAVVPADDLREAARAKAAQLMTLNMPAHAATKIRARQPALTALLEAIEVDDAEFMSTLS